MSLAGLNFDAYFVRPLVEADAFQFPDPVQGGVDWSGEPVVQTLAAHQERVWALLTLNGNYATASDLFSSTVVIRNPKVRLCIASRLYT